MLQSVPKIRGSHAQLSQWHTEDRSRSNFDPDPDQVADSGAMSSTHQPTMLSVVPYCGGSAAASARPETENEEDVSDAETEQDLRQASSEYRINAIQDQRAPEIEDSRAASTWRRTPEFDLVVLVSAGITKAGGHWLRHEFPFLDSSGYWHRIDRIFDHVERLKRYGTTLEAQNQFKECYPGYVRYLRWATDHLFHFNCFICLSGHHRSVAFVELLRQWLLSHFPGLRVVVWHLDHHREGDKQLDHHRECDLAALKRLMGTHQLGYEELFEDYISELYNCLPLPLLHDQDLRPREPP